MRFQFFTVFQKAGGGLTPLVKVRFGGVSFGPGTRFTKGVRFSGVDIFDHYGKDVIGEYEGDILVITGFS